MLHSYAVEMIAADLCRIVTAGGIHAKDSERPRVIADAGNACPLQQMGLHQFAVVNLGVEIKALQQDQFSAGANLLGKRRFCATPYFFPRSTLPGNGRRASILGLAKPRGIEKSAIAKN